MTLQAYMQWKAQVKGRYTTPLVQQPEIKYRYYRFVPMAIREGGGDWCVQLSQLRLKYQNKTLTPVNAANPGGSNPPNEDPRKAIDGQISTKWLDNNRCPLVLDFGRPVSIDAYAWATANDGPYRDPISWSLEGSHDNSKWDLIDSRENYAVPMARHTFLPDLRPAGLQTPLPTLHAATEANDLIRMWELLEQGANANEITQDGMGRTPIFYARTKDAIALLVKFKANLNAKESGPDQYTPLHRAVERQSEEEILYLLAFGANINENLDNIGTPLHVAAQNLLETSAKLLIECGADISIRNKVNRTPEATALNALSSDQAKKQRVAQLIKTTEVNSSQFEATQLAANQLLDNLTLTQEIPVTADYWDEYDQLILAGFTFMSKNDWSQAKSSFEAAKNLLKDNLNNDSRADNLNFHLLALRLICLQKLGVAKDKIQAEYFQERGILEYIHTTTSFPDKIFKSILPNISFLIRPDFFCSNKSPLLPLIRERSRSLYKTVLSPTLSEILTILKEYSTDYIATNKTYYAQLDEKNLSIPTYLEALLMANDVYERTKTSAKSSKIDCSATTPANIPTLASQGWELLLTSRDAGLYNVNQYFGKVYINPAKKLIVLASKGTDNYEDCRADFELFKRRVPENYLNQANALLAAAKSKLKAEGKEDYAIYLTGHSLGGGMTELLSAQHGIPGITWDSPGMGEVIQEDNKKQTQSRSPLRFPMKNSRLAPVIGIVSQRNSINTTNHHIGRLLCMPSGWFVMQKIAKAFDINTSTILKGLLKKVGAATIEQLMTLFITPATYNALSQDVTAAYQELENTLRTHLLEGCLLKYLTTKAYDNYAPYNFEEIVRWPAGIQDGNTVPVSLSYRDRCIPLNFFNETTQFMLKNASLICQRSDFPTQYLDFKTLLGAISITDKNGGTKYSLDYLTIKGKITGDQFRLYLHNLMTSPYHLTLQNYLRKVIQELQNPPAPPPTPSQVPGNTSSAAASSPAQTTAPKPNPITPSTSYLACVDRWVQAHPYWAVASASAATVLLCSLAFSSSSPPPPLSSSFGSNLKK